MHSMYDKLNLL